MDFDMATGDVILDAHDRLAHLLADWPADNDADRRAAVVQAFKPLHGVFDWHHDDPDVAAFYASIGACD